MTTKITKIHPTSKSTTAPNPPSSTTPSLPILPSLPTIASNLIKVFYFTTPIIKLIPYSKTLTITSFIQRDLDTYLIENNDTIRFTQPAQTKKSLKRRVLNPIATQ
jgi:hypothetical protein